MVLRSLQTYSPGDNAFGFDLSTIDIDGAITAGGTGWNQQVISQTASPYIVLLALAALAFLG